MKKEIFLSLGLLAFTAAVASAQSMPSTSTTTPSMNMHNGDTSTSSAPVAGKASLTESQAHNRLGELGYTDISALKQDEKSIWRGTATKDGKSGDVAIDHQGNIVND